VNGKIVRTLLRITRANGWTIALLLVLNSFQLLVGNYTNVAFQRLLDGFPGAHQLNDLVPLLAWYIGSWIANHFLIYLEGIPATMINMGVTQWVKLYALEKISRIDFQAYQDLGTGNLVQVIENGAQATQRILNGFYINNLLGLVQFAVGMYFIRTYDRTLFTIILAGYGFFYLISFYLMRYLHKEMENMLSNQEDFSKFSVRALMEMVVFRVNVRFKAEYERLKGISDEIVRSRTKVYLLQELSYTGFAFLIFLVEAGVVIQQATKILAGESTVGTLVALVAFTHLVFTPIIGLAQSWMAYKLDSVAFDHFDRFISLPDDPGLARPALLKMDGGSISFEHVDFDYPGHSVLRNFSLRIEGRQMTAFVGTSGSGKSTLVRLLLNLLKPQRGQVCVDGQDLAGINLDSFYRSVAYIPQEPPIFDGTIRENLTFNRPASRARLEEIIHLAGLSELMVKLPQGLDTIVGERGLKLSGGERQRLAFGRVLLQDPQIVILDEPTSALDSVSEDFITHNMIPFLKGKTVIVVAHRLQTVKDADRIIVLEDGQVVQQGSFETLLAIEGKFRQLWEAQVKEPLPAAPPSL
jgi:ATP-binding cassette, subfamily B, bacterial